MKALSSTFLLISLCAVTGCSANDGGGTGAPPIDDSSTGSEPSAPGATETNAAPVPCTSDAACPPGIDCVVASGAETGFCDVDETAVSEGDGAADQSPADQGGTSSAAPAPCTSDADCGGEVVCLQASGPNEPGFCDVEEAVVAPDQGPSLGAPAPCSSDGDCPEGIACVSLASPDGQGFCDVVEMMAL